MAFSATPWPHDDVRDLAATAPPAPQVTPPVGQLRLLVLPGTYRAQADSLLVARFVRSLAPGRRVLDVCTGSGVLAVMAAAAGASSVTAVDVSFRCVLNTWFNARRHGLDVRVRRGDLLRPVAGQQFDLVVCNPPYVPSATDTLPRHTAARSWDGGIDGRAVVDRFCASVAQVLAPGGRLLLVHSSVIDVETTLARLGAGGVEGQVVARVGNRFGPVMRARERSLRQRAFLADGQQQETLVVIEGVLAPG